MNIRNLGMLVGLLILSGSIVGCGPTGIKRLSPVEWNHYKALRVYMNDDIREVYLDQETEVDRNQFLHDAGLWERYYQYPEYVRAEIIAGNVALGWTKDKLLMSWGRPQDRGRVAGRQARISERWVYRFEQHTNGTLRIWEPGSSTSYHAARLFQRVVLMDDDIVVDITDSDDW